ncbi:MAG: AAA family ATPase [Pyrinomonadaceae bacterium]
MKISQTHGKRETRVRTQVFPYSVLRNNRISFRDECIITFLGQDVSPSPAIYSDVEANNRQPHFLQIDLFMISINITNSNNIKSASLSIRKDHLNLRYAMNGTGKTTIARSITLAISKGDMGVLKSFGGDSAPTCDVSPEQATVEVFDEDFVNNVVFQDSDAIRNAFEVFIKSAEFDEREAAVNERLKSLHIDLGNDEAVNNLLGAGNEVLTKFSVTKNGDNLKNVGLLNSLTSSTSIFKLPPSISRFEPLLTRSNGAEWVGWKHSGSSFDDQGLCPFCSVDLDGNYKQAKQDFSDSYKKSNVDNMLKMLTFVDRVREFMSDEAAERLIGCIRNNTDSEAVHLQLRRFYFDLQYLVNTVSRAVTFTSTSVKREQLGDLVQILEEHFIDASQLQIFNSEKSLTIINSVNERIKKVQEEVDDLKIEISKLKSLIGKSITNAREDVNEFLCMAGINYEFDVEYDEQDNAKAVLKYVRDDADPVLVSTIKNHLSWGERNSIALVLFLHHCAARNPELVILDDPISSFDSNKKYAILHRLFSKSRKSLYQNTVLMLTHDLQPVIDFVKSSKPTGGSIDARFLRNEAGSVQEIAIASSDINSFTQYLRMSACDENAILLHRLSCLRKFIEYARYSEQCDAAYNLLSSMFHLRNEPKNMDLTPIAADQIELGTTYIRNFIGDFDYETAFVKNFSTKALIEAFKAEPCEFHKVQIFRILIEDRGIRSKVEDPLIKYIDEQFHVENDYTYFLDPQKYNTVPPFVVPKCIEFLKKEGVV